MSSPGMLASYTHETVVATCVVNEQQNTMCENDRAKVGAKGRDLHELPAQQFSKNSAPKGASERQLKQILCQVTLYRVNGQIKV